MDTDKRNMSELVRAALRSKTPLQYILSSDLCREIAIDRGEYHAIDTALRRHALGDKVAKNQPPKEYFAIRFGLPSKDNVEKEIFLSLPGIPHDYLMRDDTSTPEVNACIAELETVYGNETINYWVRLTQYNSVSLIRDQMEEAKKRDGQCCRICQAIIANNLFPDLSNYSGRKVTACHIISRRTVFWLTLHRIHLQFALLEQRGIFSDTAVLAFQNALLAEPLHSSKEYIVTLCVEHNRQLLQVLREAV